MAVPLIIKTGDHRRIDSTVDPLTLSNTGANSINVLELTKAPSSAAGGNALYLTTGTNATGHGLNILHDGAGSGIFVSASSTGSALSLNHSGSAAVAGITNDGTGRALDITHNTASIEGLRITRSPTAGTISGNAVLLVMGGGVGTASGDGLGITMGGNATGAAIRLTMTNTAAQAFVLSDSAAFTNAMFALTRSSTTATGPIIQTSSNNAAALSAVHASSTGATCISLAGGASTNARLLALNDTGVNLGTMMTLNRSGVGANGNMLSITKNPASSSTSGDGIAINWSGGGGTVTSNAISVANASTGDAVNVAISNTAAQALVVTESTAGTNPMIELTRSTTGATGALISLTKSPAATTAGTMLDLVSSGTFFSGTMLALTLAGNFGCQAINISNTTANLSKTLVISRAPSAGTPGGNVVEITVSSTSGNSLDITTSSGSGTSLAVTHTSTGTTMNVVTQAGAGANAIAFTNNISGGGGTYFSLSSNDAGSVVFLINKTPSGTQSGSLLRLVSGTGFVTSPMISVVHNGTGAVADISNASTSGNCFTISQSSSGTMFALSLGSVTTAKVMTLADANVSTNPMFTLSRNGDGATGAFFSLTKSPGTGAATSGNMFDITMGSGTTGHAFAVQGSYSGTQVAASSVATSPGTQQNNILTLVGGTGGATSIATTGVGGIGSGITLTCGNGGLASSAATSSTGGAGGTYQLNAGTGGSASAAGTTRVGGSGGFLTMAGGIGGTASGGTTNTAGVGGLVSLTGGVGGAGANGGTANAGGAGGGLTLSGGTGGVAGSAVTGAGGVGGSPSLLGGTGGAGTASNPAGAGGGITIQGGTAGANNGGGGANGGTLTLTGGTPTGAGTYGKVLIAQGGGFVGIAQATPTVRLHLNENGITTNSTAGLLLENSTAATGAVLEQNSPALQFNAHAWSSFSSADQQLSAAIFLDAFSSAFTESRLSFLMGFASPPTTQAMVIRDNLGSISVGIGNILTPTTTLHVSASGAGDTASASGSGILAENATNAFVAARDSTNNIETAIGVVSGTTAYVGTTTNHALSLHTNNASKWSISTAGTLSNVSNSIIALTNSAATDTLAITHSGGSDAIAIDFNNAVARGCRISNNTTITGNELLLLERNAAGSGGPVLAISAAPASAQSGDGLVITWGANCTTEPLTISHAGSASGVILTVSSASNANPALNLDHAGSGRGVDISMTGTGIGLAVAGDASVNTNQVFVDSNHSTYTSQQLLMDSDATGTGFDFIRCRSNVATAADTEFRVRGDGTIFADNGTISSPADYAECVIVANDKSTYAPGDVLRISGADVFDLSNAASQTSIAGVISANPAVLGGHLGQYNLDLTTGTLESHTWTLAAYSTGDARWLKVAISGGDYTANYPAQSFIRVGGGGDDRVRQIQGAVFDAGSNTTFVLLDSDFEAQLSSAASTIYYGVQTRNTVCLAMLGRVVTKCITQNGTIVPGDLLVASDTAGRAMKAPANPAAGTLLGKALGTLTDDTSGTVTGELLAYINLM